VQDGIRHRSDEQGANAPGSPFPSAGNGDLFIRQKKEPGFLYFAYTLQLVFS